MCLTYPALVTSTSDGTARIALSGRERHASTVLVPDVHVGDWVIVAAGTILERIDPQEAREIATLLDADELIHGQASTVGAATTQQESGT